jgi:hypothetical protein
MKEHRAGRPLSEFMIQDRNPNVNRPWNMGVTAQP